MFKLTQEEKNTLRIPITDSDHAQGPAEAPIQIVHYGDYECAGCRRMNRAVLKLARPLWGRLRYVYRHFPLIGVHPSALRAAEAAEASAAQGKFWEMHEQLFANPDRITDRHLLKYAGKLGLDVERFKRDLKEGKYGERIKEGNYLSLLNGVTGAPTFYLNGVLFAGSSGELIRRIKIMLGSSREI